jgi:hypothetical protein
MPLLDHSNDTNDRWRALQEANQLRVEVDLDEVERVLELARRAPGLAAYEAGFRQLAIFFETANRELREHDPGALADFVSFWERYRAVIIQRFTGITPVELRAADAVVANIFDHFIRNVPTERVAYADDATPLVFGGEGGIGAYFTHPPGWNRPFGIINLPHAAFDNVWQWLALPHETGHDLYATVDGLEQELENALADRMQQAVNDGEVAIDDVDVDLNPFGVPYHIEYTGADLLATIWRSWANEAQADIVGLLTCGGAALVALQQIVEFSNLDSWHLRRSNGGFVDEPEEHPTSYVRNTLNIAALRRIGGGHAALATEIETRFHALRPSQPEIVWDLEGIPIVHVPADQVEASALIAAELLVDHQFNALGGQSYSDLVTFTANDQTLVEQLVDPLLAGDPTFAQLDGVEPRHALAATVFAFEQDRTAASVINRTFKHFA